uniref:Uncharacterized protein n=1 Tax=Arundo donax TaxID=35708 RepID=A0A0A9A5D7_ARUDO
MGSANIIAGCARYIKRSCYMYISKLLSMVTSFYKKNKSNKLRYTKHGAGSKQNWGGQVPSEK